MSIATTLIALQPARFDMLEQTGGGELLLTIHEVRRVNPNKNNL